MIALLLGCTSAYLPPAAQIGALKDGQLRIGAHAGLVGDVGVEYGLGKHFSLRVQGSAGPPAFTPDVNHYVLGRGDVGVEYGQTLALVWFTTAVGVGAGRAEIDLDEGSPTAFVGSTSYPAFEHADWFETGNAQAGVGLVVPALRFGLLVRGVAQHHGSDINFLRLEPILVARTGILPVKLEGQVGVSMPYTGAGFETDVSRGTDPRVATPIVFGSLGLVVELGGGKD
jgi:hypothetical protein